MITKLKDNQIFVFGSNLAGRHGKGAALTAQRKFGARNGIGTGPTGKCYAIATKDRSLNVRKLVDIQIGVNRFINYTRRHPELEFLVTAIGCGLAKYKAKDIAPFFKDVPSNVVLPKEFLDILNKEKNENISNG